MRFLGPFLVFLLLLGLLYKGLALEPARSNPSTVLVNKPAPAFRIGTLENPSKILDEALWSGKISVLNVWASWCIVCTMEHKTWMQTAKVQDPFSWQLVGLNYHDGLEEARAFLRNYGNPYHINLFDPRGTLGMEFGVHGTPETFVIDHKGIIRYRHQGMLTADLWQQKVWPLIQQLSDSVVDPTKTKAGSL